jgi:hypothetical protein
MGSIDFIPSANPSEEVVLVGRHRGIDVVVLGTHGGQDAWAAGFGLVDAYLDSDALGDNRVLVVDVTHANVRGARTLDYQAGQT